jgi:3-hydroxybutyryl-CoA dehydrogenase
MEKVISADDIRRVAVLGAGTMGRGIAQVSALAGCEVVVRDLEERFVQGALAGIRANLDGGVERGKIPASTRDEAIGRIRGTTSVADAVAEADAVIEAVPEDLALKRATFTEVETHAPGRALLASNTSSLSISVIASGLRDPGRFVGMHFFNPAHILKLVEIVVGPATSPEAAACARDLGVRMGKDPIIVRDSPGFASSRLGLTLGLEAMRMLEGGVASAEDIDKAMTLGYGHPMGPLKLTDLVGLDVRLAIADYLETELGPAYAAPRILREHVAAGKLGKKSGEGFYIWQGDTAHPRPSGRPKNE